MNSQSFRVFAFLLLGALFAAMVSSPAPNRPPYVSPQDLRQTFLGSSSP